ncbi:MAG: hypothetical protein HC817_13315, partial [Saprospiraceae bacterium]|nr:hypothetical protein [Saprospiraceae bacterium]
MAALKSGDEKSPYRLYTQAQVQLFWAMNHAKYGNWIALSNNLSTAYELLEKNQRLFPQFMANKMSLGVLHCLVSTVPDSYKWVVRFVSGMNGTMAQGLSEIEEVLAYAKKSDFVFEQEALVMYAFLMMHLNNQSEKAWQLVSTS